MFQRHRQVCPRLAVDLVKPYHPRAVRVHVSDDEREKVQIEMDDGEVWPVERRWFEARVVAHKRRLRDGPPQLDLFRSAC